MIGITKMSAALHDVLIRTNDDPLFRAALLEKDVSVLDSYGLTEEETAALLSGDEGKLYRLLDSAKYFYIRENGNYGEDGGDGDGDV